MYGLAKSRKTGSTNTNKSKTTKKDSSVKNKTAQKNLSKKTSSKTAKNNKENWKTKNKCGCPKVNHNDYELKKFRWKKKFFYKVKLPLLPKKKEDILKEIDKAIEEIKSKGYGFNQNKHMILHEENRWWRKGKLLIEVEKADPKDKKIKVFDDKHIYSKSHVGHIHNLRESLDELGVHLKDKGKVKDIYYWYLSCPHCTKDLKDFKTVIFVELK